MSDRRPPALPVRALLAVCVMGLWAPATAQNWARLLIAQNDPVNWLVFGHDLSGQRFSALDQVNRETVRRLVLKWSSQFGTNEAQERSYCTPLVSNGTMYVTGPENLIFAIDARTGRSRWRKDMPIPEELRAVNGLTNYGAALHEGRLYWVTSDAQLYCLQTISGATVWSVKMADHKIGYRGRGMPLPLRDRVIVGVSTGRASVRGFIDAYDIKQGKRLWRFYSIPIPGERGSETWEADSWMAGGGETWMTGAYDDDLNLLYWSIGGPEPRYAGEVRPGENLYTNCIAALNPQNGGLVWHYQCVPHSVWGYAEPHELIQVDLEWEGRMRKALVSATSGGYFVALDRETGEFLYAVPYARQMTWSTGVDRNGQPVVDANRAPAAGTGMKEYSPDAEGARSAAPVAYSPRTRCVYLFRREGSASICPDRAIYRQGRPYRAGAQESRLLPSAFIAVDVRTGRTVWETPTAAPMTGGVLATAGGLVFTGDDAGYFRALDEATGKEVWSYQMGVGIAGSPVSFRVEGKQRIAIVAGNGVLNTFGLFEPLTGDLVRIDLH